MKMKGNEIPDNITCEQKIVLDYKRCRDEEDSFLFIPHKNIANLIVNSFFLGNFFFLSTPL